MGVVQNNLPEYTIYHYPTEISNHFYTNYNGQETDTGILADAAWHTLIVDHKNKKQIFDGVEKTLAGTPFTTSIPYFFFAGNKDGTAMWFSDYQISSVKIWDDDILQRDFVPVQRRSDSSIGFLELVNDLFYSNSGTGTFLYG